MGRGIPTPGDRSATDALAYPTRHANDIDNGIHWTLTRLQELFAAVTHTHAHFTDTSNPHGVTAAQVGLGNVANLKCNLAATTAPGVSDDSTAGYAVGSSWFNLTADKAYVCLDATAGAAVWKEVGGSGPGICMLTVSSVLALGSNPLRVYNPTGAVKNIVKVFIAVDTAPVGAAIIVDVHKNGTTIFTTQSNRPQISDGSNTGVTTSIDTPTWNDGEYLTLDIDQIGSSIPGSNLSVHVVYTS